MRIDVPLRGRSLELLSSCARYVCSREIRADIEQRTVSCFRHFIGKAVAKVQAGRVHASAPLRMDSCHPFGHSRGHTDDFKGQAVDQAGHFAAKAAPPCGNRHG